MPIENESWWKYAESKGITKSDAQRYWNTAKESGKEDYEKVMGIFKIIIDNSLKSKKESFIGVQAMTDADAIKCMKKMQKDDKPDLTPFIGYAKNQGLDNEKQASAIFYAVRGKVAKKQDEDPEKLSGETMGILWGEYKKGIEDAVKASKSKDSKKEATSKDITLTKEYIIEGLKLSQGANLSILENIEAIEESFGSGKANSVANKVGNILGRKIGTTFTTAQTPLGYDNEYGSFAGYYMLGNNGLLLRCNFLLAGSESIESFDVYLDGPSDTPDYTLETSGLNIVQIIDMLTENLIDDGEASEDTLQEENLNRKVSMRERVTDPDTPEGVAEKLDSLVKENKNALSDLQKLSIPDIFNGLWADWVSDKPNYQGIKYYIFVKGVKAFLLQRGLVNKTCKPRKKGSRERVIEDPVLASQLDELVTTIGWEEKFDFLRKIVQKIGDGSYQSLICRGDPGSGKTRTVKDTLDENNIDYVDYSGGVKSVEDLMYILFTHKDGEILLFDDCDSVLKKDANIWKAILQNTPERIVTYANLARKGKMAKVDQKFSFTSGVIFITNEYKLDSAIESRSIVLTIDLTNDDMLAKIQATLEKFRPDVPMKQKQEAVDFASEIAKGVRNIDYRMLEKIFIAQDIYPSNWKKYALMLMNN
jgi:hypothetical protein